MQRAQTGALLQQTNQAILQIRQAELNYYVSFYLTFSTQAALIGGFVYSGLTQIQFKADNRDYRIFPYFQDAFWICSACTMAASMHCILTSMFLQVLGPGLALNGPIGSMAKAADGMRSEIKHIFFSFIAMAIGFAASVLCSFWVVMDRRSAIAGSCFFVLSAFVWWHYCSKIYNRFNYGGVSDNFLVDEDAVAPGVDALENDYRLKGETDNPMHSAAAASSSATDNGSTLADESQGSGMGKSVHSSSEPVMRGFLTKRELNKSAVSGSKYTWVRNYFLIAPSGRMFAFKSLKAFEANPNKPRKGRPLELSWYEISSYSFLDEETGESLIYEIRMEYSDKDDAGRAEVFRCDTAAELTLWLNAMKRFSSSSLKGDDAEYSAMLE